MSPSGNSLLGLVKHLASVEYGWFCETFGRPVEPLWFDADTDEDLRVGPEESTEASPRSTAGRGPRPTP